MKTDIKNCDFQALCVFAQEHNQPRYRIQQLFTWIYQKHVDSLGSIKNLPQAFLKALEGDFYFSQAALKKSQISKDGTQKFLFELEDGNIIESVSIPHKHRITLCLSTQVGCRYGCQFCASTKAGFVRNLNQAEILNQIIAIAKLLKGKRISNIVFMGIGEPLDNYENVCKAIAVINAPYGFGIGQRKITISTVGIPHAIKRFSCEGLQVELAVSLHSADEEKRSQLMPINKKYPLSVLLPTLHAYTRKTKRKITFEYLLLGGFNVGEDDAKQLITCLKGIHATINLIIFNQVSESPFRAPTKNEVDFFKTFLLKYRSDVVVRKSRGSDIDAACGQLRLNVGSAKQ